jgi:hypothetical protein
MGLWPVLFVVHTQEVTMDAMMEVTATEETTPAFLDVVPTSITGLIRVLYNLESGSNTYNVMLQQLLKHDDLLLPEDLQLHVNRFCGFERDRIDDFEILLNEASQSIGSS